VVEDKAFAARLAGILREAMVSQGRRMEPADHSHRPFGRRLQGWVAYALVRLALLVAGQRY
jgi:cardiolipin synthase